MKKVKKILLVKFLFLILIVVFSFFYFNLTEGPPFKYNQEKFSSLDLKKAVYSDYRAPENFYKEENENRVIYYINQSQEFNCAQNINHAQSFLEDIEFLEVSDNEKYFGFILDEGDKLGLNTEYRVIKCVYIKDLQLNYYKGNGVTYFTSEGEIDIKIGKYDQELVDEENSKELIEFLTFNENRIDNSKILSSFSLDSGDYIKHTIFETRLIEGEERVCDRIFLIKFLFRADKNSGDIYSSGSDIAKQVKGRC